MHGNKANGNMKVYHHDRPDPVGGLLGLRVLGVNIADDRTLLRTHEPPNLSALQSNGGWLKCDLNSLEFSSKG